MLPALLLHGFGNLPVLRGVVVSQRAARLHGVPSLAARDAVAWCSRCRSRCLAAWRSRCSGSSLHFEIRMVGHEGLVVVRPFRRPETQKFWVPPAIRPRVRGSPCGFSFLGDAHLALLALALRARVGLPLTIASEGGLLFYTHVHLDSALATGFLFWLAACIALADCLALFQYPYDCLDVLRVCARQYSFWGTVVL